MLTALWLLLRFRRNLRAPTSTLTRVPLKCSRVNEILLLLLVHLPPSESINLLQSPDRRLTKHPREPASIHQVDRIYVSSNNCARLIANVDLLRTLARLSERHSDSCCWRPVPASHGVELVGRPNRPSNALAATVNARTGSKYPRNVWRTPDRRAHYLETT